MIPGSVSKVIEGSPVVAASTILITAGEVIRISGTTPINTIIPPFGTGQNQVIWIIPTDPAGVTLGTTGNILVGIAAAQNRTVQLIWLASTSKWYIENGV
jgi:hypothetical protein